MTEVEVKVSVQAAPKEMLEALRRVEAEVRAIETSDLGNQVIAALGDKEQGADGAKTRPYSVNKRSRC